MYFLKIGSKVRSDFPKWGLGFAWVRFALGRFIFAFTDHCHLPSPHPLIHQKAPHISIYVLNMFWMCFNMELSNIRLLKITIRDCWIGAMGGEWGHKEESGRGGQGDVVLHYIPTIVFTHLLFLGSEKFLRKHHRFVLFLLLPLASDYKGLFPLRSLRKDGTIDKD